MKHVVIAALGDLLGAKGLLVNFVLRHVKKMVPRWDLPGALRFNAVLAEGRREGTEGRAGRSRGPRVPAVHRRHDRRVEGRDAAAPEHPRQSRAGHGLDTAVHEGERAAGHDHRAAAVPHPLADGELPVDDEDGRLQRAHHQSARHPRVRQGTRRGTSSPCSPGSTRCSTRCSTIRDFAGLDFSGLRVSLGGGMAVQKPVADRWKKITGCTLVEAYGLSETSPAVTINPLDLKDYNGSIGLPISSTEVVLRGDDGKEVPLGSAGEICVRGPQVMKGYWNSPGGDRQGARARRLFRHRRCRGDGRAGLREDRRPQEGHAAGVGLQRLPERDRVGGGRCTRACSSAPSSASRTSTRARCRSSSS